MPTIDLHVDVPWQFYRHDTAFDLSLGTGLLQVDFPRMDEGGLDKIVAALYLSDGVQDRLGPTKSWELILKQAKQMKAQQGDRILLGLEGGRLLNAADHIHELKDLGITYVTLTHNKNTMWADSATDNLKHNGLTAVGKRLVSKIESLGVFIDVSHASDETTIDAISQAKRPVIATHSGVRALVDHPRNLSDFLIKELVKTGGLIGVPYATRFVGDADGVVEAIDHIAQLVGNCDHLAIGSDLDGADTICEDVAQWSKVLAPLSDLGYSADDIAGIKGANFWRLLNGGN